MAKKTLKPASTRTLLRALYEDIEEAYFASWQAGANKDTAYGAARADSLEKMKKQVESFIRELGRRADGKEPK